MKSGFAKIVGETLPVHIRSVYTSENCQHLQVVDGGPGYVVVEAPSTLTVAL